MNADVPSHALRLCSREFALVCTQDGRILEADARALHHLHLLPGDNLIDRAATGAGDKVQRMLADARPDPSEPWEVGVVHNDRVVTVRFYTQASGTGPDATLRLLGSLAPEDSQAVLAAQSAALDEVVSLNRQVVRQRAEAERLNAALADSNAGVLALHAALEERLSATTEEASLKSRIIQHVSHELRTPLHSVLGMAQLLLSEQDGPLTAEQRTQVHHMQTATEDLSLLVSDLLDLSAIEAGAAAVHPERFGVQAFLSGLRGALLPLVVDGSRVALEVEPPAEEILLETDRVKLGQILRNLVGNALKFTEQGTVAVRVRVEGQRAVFAIEDTGPGIAPDDQARIFEEFVRLPSASHVTGTGLGLPVARGLARLLGGDLTLASTPGVGSLFEASVLLVHPEARALRTVREQAESVAQAARPGEPVLVIEDDRRTSVVYERYLSQAGFPVMVAASLPRAQALLQTVRPAAIVLDILLGRDSSWAFLQQLKEDPHTADIPVLVVTVRGDANQARALGADEFWLKPVQPERLVRRLTALAPGPRAATVLIIDDNPRDRYLLSRVLEDTPHEVLEASSGEEGVRLARDHRPDVIVLDFLLRGETAFDVLDALKADPDTRRIPVIVSTSHELSAEQRGRLSQKVGSVMNKANLGKELAIHRIQDALSAAGVHPVAEAVSED